MTSIRKLFFSHVAQTSDFPLAIEVSHAEGSIIYDVNGKDYVDFDSGISVSAIGHRHPDVINAIHDQCDKYLHTMVYGEHIQTPQVEFAKMLSDVLNTDKLTTIYFVNSGSEAVEAAIKLARKATQRFNIISAHNAYHGSTIGCESLRSDLAFTQHYMPGVPGVHHIHFNDYEDLHKINEETAAVIIEPIQGEAGIILPKSGYLQALKNKCIEKGALLIFDEIQTGFGRTGDLFAFQDLRVTPDILLMAKAMGGGMPCGALMSSQQLLSHFTRNPALGHITTFGGHPVPIAAAVASLKFLLKNDIIQSSHPKSLTIYQSLINHPMVEEIRYKGMFLAVQLKNASLLSLVVSKIIQQGVLVDYFLFNGASFRISPPLTISEQDLQLGINRIISALNQVSQTSNQ